MIRGSSSGRTGQRGRLRAGGDDAVLERDRAVADDQRVRAGEAADAVDDLDLALLGQPDEPAGEPVDDRVLPAAQRLQVDLRLAELDRRARPSPRASAITRAACSSALDGMQPTFRQTPPSALVALDQRRLQPEVGGAEGGGVAARARAEDHHLGVDARAVGRGAGGASAVRARSATASGVAESAGSAAVGLERQQHAALRDPVADLDPQLGDRPRLRRGHVHRRLVGLERDQRILDRDLVSGGDVDLDHRDVGEVPDVGDADFGGLTAAPAAGRRARPTR